MRRGARSRKAQRGAESARGAWDSHRKLLAQAGSAEPGNFELRNHSGYDSGDLRRFVAACLRATRTRVPGLVVIIVSSPSRTKGCADIGGRRMTIAVGPPSRLSLARLALILTHEAAHLRGVTHERMPERLLYSEGPGPSWARGLRLRHRRRAPPQLGILRRERLTGF